MNRSSAKPEKQVKQAADIPHTLRMIEEHLAAIRFEACRSLSVWLTPEEAADELSVSRDTIDRLIASGKLRATEINATRSQNTRHRYRIHRDWLDSFLNQNVHRTEKRTRRRQREWRDFIG